MKKNFKIQFFAILSMMLISSMSWGQNLFTQDTLTVCGQSSWDFTSPFPSAFNVWKKSGEEEVIVSPTMTFRSSGWYHLFSSTIGVNDISVCQVFNLANSYTASLNVPLGHQITGLQIALWGTPNVNCANPTPSSCNLNVTSILNRSFLGKTNFTYYSGEFSDPCLGTQKYLYAKYICTPYVHDSIYINIIPFSPTINVSDTISCDNSNQIVILPTLTCDTTFQLIQTLSQSANNTSQSTLTLDKGQLYRLKISNTVSFGGGASNQKDAAFTSYTTTPVANIFWRFNGYQPGPLPQFRPFPDGYSTSHIYYFYFISDGAPQDIGAYDCCPGDNSGSLSITLEKVVINSNCGLNYQLNNITVSNSLLISPSNQINHLYITNSNAKCLVDSFYIYPSIITSVDLGSDTITLCSEGTTLVGTNPAAGSYIWNTGEITPTLDVTYSGEYSLTITDTLGCSSSDSIFVSIIYPDIFALDSAFCIGDSTLLTVNNNALISWSDGTTNQSSIQVQPNQTTTYSVTVSDGVGTCVDSITIQVNNPQINAGSDLSVCEGETATLTSTGADTYAWDNGVVNGEAFVPTVEGYYTVIGTDTLGCSNSASVFLDLLQPTSSTISPISCDTHTAPDNEVYSNSGQYTAVIPNAAGCDSTITINLTLNKSTESSQTISEIDSYTWPVNGLTYYQSGVYNAVIPNSVGCDSTITLNLSLEYTGIIESNNFDLKIIPNPVDVMFTVHSNSLYLGKEFIITNNKGEIVSVGTLKSSIMKVDCTNLTKGIYFFTLNSPEQHVIRFIKN
jgi:hypothetical protein